MPYTAYPDPETEAALLARLRGDDDTDASAAAVEIVTRYRPLIERAALYVLDDWDPAQDVAQEVSLTFLRNHRTVRIRDGLQQYFRSAGRTRALNLLRTERRAQQWDIDAVECTVENDALLRLTVDDLVLEVSRAIQTMPERRRRVFIAITRDRRTRRDVADEFGISLQTVENNIWLANNHIRRCLKEGTWSNVWSAADLTHITEKVWTFAETSHA